MKPIFLRRPSRSLAARLVATTLVPALALASVPPSAANPAQPSAPAAIKVNRTVPKVRPVPLRPVLSADPSDLELFKARVFEEPFVPVGGRPTPEENRALADAIEAFVAGGDRLNLTPFERFLWENEASPWRASLRANMGLAYMRAGRFTRASASWEEAWHVAKDQEDALSRAVADRALGELANLRSLFAQVTEAERLLHEAEGRRMSGSAVEKLNAARVQLSARTEHPQLIHPTGAMALSRILANRSPEHQGDPRLESFRAPQYGSTLTQVEALAQEVGLDLRMAYHADKSAPIEVPSVAHLSMGHYAAVVARNEAGTRYLLDDPAFGAPMWMTREALLEEVSGYFLIDGKELPAGWHAVAKADGDRILGRCLGPGNPNSTTPQDETEGGEKPCPGMATYSFHALAVSLRIIDTPVGYAPSRGPAVNFNVTYNHKEATQPQTFTYSNLGSRWTFDQLSFIEDQDLERLKLHVRGGGQEIYTYFDGQGYTPHFKSQNVVVRVSSNPIVWEVRRPDGSTDVYAQPDCGVCSGRRVFMTESRDPAGNALSFTYDQDLRLVAITDALGQVTTLSYELGRDPWKITRVTDPFGRSAQFEYDTLGHLIRITDVIGLTSEFAYASSDQTLADFITALTTPYGTTTFRQTVLAGGKYSVLEATDPLGGTERITYDKDEWYTPAEQRHPYQDDPALAPVGFERYNTSLNEGLTHYWSKRAMTLYPGDYRKAKVIRWFTDIMDWRYPTAWYTSGVKQSERLPLENRVWYAYEGGATTVLYGGLYRGPSALPTQIGRVLDDGSSQIHRYEYNALGKVIRATDPVGKTTTYTYDTNEIDLLEVRQVNGQNTELLWSATYNDKHQPLTVTNASGQTWTKTYNDQGQVLTMTTPARAGINENRTTTYAYDSNGYLQSVTGPATGATSSFTYDSYGRVRTATNPDGYTVTYDYDALDRMTKTAYPDGTFEETIYNRLDAEQRRDRLGHWTHTFYDALRRVVAVRDPAGRTTQLQYEGSGCASCGGGGAKVSALIDPDGHATRWDYDLQGRVIQETRPDGSSAAVTYETTSSRVKQIRDRKQQTIDLEYFLDNKWKRVSYSNTTQPTPSVSFTYDPVYNRLATITDGTGTTSYSFYPVTTPPTLGTGRLQTVDGPLGNDSITYGHDEVGRVVSRGVNGVGVSFTYDALGRLSSEANSLGTFTYGYDGVVGRVTSVTHPGGRNTSYSYEGNTGDHRLQQIVNQGPGSTALSSFQYTSDPSGLVTSWTQQANGDPAKVYGIGRDAAQRLTAAVLSTTDPTPTVLKRYRYAYDAAGNRTTEQVDDVAVAATYDTLDALTGLQPGGALAFRGTLNEPATVVVQGHAATVDATNAFHAQAQVGSGATNVIVTAADPSGNTRTNTYQVSATGAATTLAYDANGNLTSDGSRTFEWDGANRLTAVTLGTHRSEFGYDGWGHRVRIVEKDSGAVASDRRFLWCGTTLCEERDAAGTGVVRRFFAQGIEDEGTPFFYAMDHLGNVRELTDASGAVRARYDYDPYGRATKLSGDKDSVFTYAGLMNHSPTGLLLATFRAYDAGLGRWISRDPIGLAGGPNAYAYAGGAPLDAIDPLGLLQPGPIYGGVGAGLAAGAILTGTGVGTIIGVGIIVVILVTQTGDGHPTDPQGDGGGGGGSGTNTGGGTDTTTTTGPGPAPPPPPPPPPPPTDPDCPKRCPECDPPVGSRGCRYDVDQQRPHQGYLGPHYHVFKRGQKPYPDCTCVWNPTGEWHPGEPPADCAVVPHDR